MEELKDRFRAWLDSDDYKPFVIGGNNGGNLYVKVPRGDDFDYLFEDCMEPDLNVDRQIKLKYCGIYRKSDHTLACGKYRFNDLDIGTIGGLPRIMDMGQCNDAYGAIRVAVALSEAFGCGVNELPLSMILSWYEQKAVCILLTLLYLGIKNIRLGPSLPAFISPNVLNYLVENYNIAPISTPEEDLKSILG